MGRSCFFFLFFFSFASPILDLARDKELLGKFLLLFSENRENLDFFLFFEVIRGAEKKRMKDYSSLPLFV